MEENKKKEEQHSHHGERHHHRKKGRRKKILIIASCTVVFVVGSGVLGFAILRAMGQSNIRSASTTVEPNFATSEAVEVADEDGTITYEGRQYRYNDGIVTLLIMGIDANAPVKETDKLGTGGQADAIFLMVLDEANGEARMIAIPRDTQTRIDIYDYYGTYFTTGVDFLAYQYAYGDGRERSSENMVRAVSNLMYELPIHGYVTLKMDAIPIINDAVGGVTVTVPDDPDFNRVFGYTTGQSVTLQGQRALDFIHRRDHDTQVESNFMRIARQKAWMLGMADSARTAIRGNLTFPITLYNKITPYMYTSIGVDQAAYLATTLLGLEFDTDDIQIIQGTVQPGINGDYDRFFPDENELYDLIIRNFYTEVESLQALQAPKIR